MASWFKLNLNPYRPIWVTVGLISGILAYNFLSLLHLVIFLLILIGLGSRNQYLRLYVIGCFLGAARIYIADQNVKSNKIKYRDVELLGELRNNILHVHAITGPYIGHEAKFIVVNKPEVEPDTILKCKGTLMPMKHRKLDNILEYMKNYYNNIIGYINISSYTCVGKVQNSPIQYSIRKMIEGKFEQPARSLLLAILLGDSGEISQDLYNTMTVLGISHLLVVSAMHFGLFSGVFYLVFRWILAPLFIPSYISMHRFAQLGIFLGACVYFVLVKPSWPVIRSFTSVLIMITLILFNRRSTAFQNITITLLIMLALYPQAVFDIGFQLSFISVFTLILFRTNLLTSTLYVSLATAPIVLYKYGYLNLQPFLASIICIPFFSYILMPLSVINLFSGFALSALFTKAVNLFLMIINYLSHIFILPINYYISLAGLGLSIMSITSWPLFRNKLLSIFLSILALLLMPKRHGPSIILDPGLQNIYLYENKVIYTNADLEKTRFVKYLLNASYVLPVPESLKTKYGYRWHGLDIYFDKGKLTQIKHDGVSVVTAWYIKRGGESVLLTVQQLKS